MSKKYLIGIDIGTQGTKTSLFNLEGNRIAEGFEASNLISPEPGIVEQKPEEIYYSVMNTVKKVVSDSDISGSEVAAIGLDGQMAGIIGIDNMWNAVTPYDSWLDNRCEKYIEVIRKKAEDKVVGITGCPVTYAHGPKILWWKYERPEIYSRISKFVMPTTYVAGRMCRLKSKQAYIDYTHLHFSGFGNVERKVWSQELLELFDVDEDKMPEIVEPWKVVGLLGEEEARKCGLQAGIPVAAGCGDQAATSLGAGVTKKGIVFDVAGTASVFSCCVDKFNPDVKNKTLIYARSVIDGLWTPLAYINGGGLCLKWFKDNLTGRGEMSSYEQLNEEGSHVPPGSEGLLFVPHFAGRVCPNNPKVRGSWIGLNWIHRRGHLYRAIMEGIAYEYSHYMDVLEELIGDFPFKRVVSIGGGARSKVFTQIKADVLGLTYTTLSHSDTATLGSAIVAGVCANLYNDIAYKVSGMVKIKNEIKPDMQNHKLYKKYVKAYEDLFGALGKTFDILHGKE